MGQAATEQEKPKPVIVRTYSTPSNRGRTSAGRSWHRLGVHDDGAVRKDADFLGDRPGPEPG